MATTDIRVWDGAAWVSLQGPDGQNGTDGINGTDGKTIADAQAFATTVDPVNNTTLGTATAQATTTDDGSGNLTLTLNLGIPAGLPGADGIVGSNGTDATVSVSSVTTNTLQPGANASVDVVDATPLDPSDLTLDFTFNIPKGEAGTGVNILGRYNTEADLIAAHPSGNPGDAYLVQGDLYVWDPDNNQWLNVGNIQGPAGADAQVHVGNVDTVALPCGSNATVAIQPAAGSTPGDLTLDFDFGIAAGCDGQNGTDGQNATITLDQVNLTEVCSGSESASFVQTSGNASNPVYDLSLEIPMFKATSSPEGNAPAGPCPGHLWIVTGP